MPDIFLTKKSAGELKIAEQAISERMEKIENAIGEPLTEVSKHLSSGWTMARGLEFMNGAELMLFVYNHSKFIIAALMEQGHLQKKLKTNVKVTEDEGTGQYL